MNSNQSLQKVKETLRDKGVYAFLHILILVLSVFLVVRISIDTFHNEAFYLEHRFLRFQFWICIVFLFDFFVEFFLADNKWHYIRSRFIFFLVSIPYNSIISFYGWTFSPQVTYALHYIPLIRGGYAMSIVVSWFTYNRATGLFISYLATLIFTIYFASLAFYVFEHHVNPLVKNYQDALWWACMDATTVGSNIVAVTPVGRILSVLLAALGMMMFPIFTVYVTNLLTRTKKQGVSIDGPIFYNTPIFDDHHDDQDNDTDNSSSGAPVVAGTTSAASVPAAATSQNQ
ncbi:MAG: two pore domain potassium channel family protein [Muribaculaceae bacterium]|nr:two pore domain potassium channel family protein [Muribaculaceae bacterium]